MFYCISIHMSTNNKELKDETPKYISDSENKNTTKYICKVCGVALDNKDNLDIHISSAHHPKRTVTVNDIVNSIFKGQINFPKTKAEIVKYIEDHKDDPSITPQVLDTIRNIKDKDYNNEGELSLELNQ
jgi:Protein of unknown function (DUF2795)